jgi:hypothetical protein
MEVVDEQRIVHRKLEAEHRHSPSARGMAGRKTSVLRDRGQPRG